MAATDPGGERLTLPDGWTETRYETGSFGPDDRPGVEARFERGSMAASVLPVRYERTDGEERVEGLAGDLTAGRTVLDGPEDVPRRTAFATRATYVPVSRTERRVVCVAHDADDALAVALWLARASRDDSELETHVRVHLGAGAGTAARDINSGDEVLSARLPASPERCLLTGVPTSSHRVAIPFRYFPLLRDAPRTSRGVPRFPSTVHSLVGVVSHRAWTEEGLDAKPFARPLDRAGPGDYRLDPEAADVARRIDAGSLALRRLGTGDPHRSV